MNRILNYTISDADAGMIVLDFLRKQGFSRHILTAMKADKEALSVNDQKVQVANVLINSVRTLIIIIIALVIGQFFRKLPVLKHLLNA